MTQETPEVEPVSTPDPKASQHLTNFWNSLSKNAKIAIGVVALVIVIIIASSGGSTPTPTTDTTQTTISIADKWNAWKGELTPIVNQTQTDYTQTQADLSNSDYSASTQDFATLSQDATNIASVANGPSVQVNNDLLDVATAIHAIASTGIAALNSTDLSAFQTAVTQYGNACDKLGTDLANANNIYV